MKVEMYDMVAILADKNDERRSRKPHGTIVEMCGIRRVRKTECLRERSKTRLRISASSLLTQ